MQFFFLLKSMSWFLRRDLRISYSFGLPHTDRFRWATLYTYLIHVNKLIRKWKITVFKLGSSSSLSADRRPLLDIGLPQGSPQWPVLRCPHPAASRDLHQVIGPPCGGPTHAAPAGTWTPLQNLSAPTAVSSASYVPCPLPLKFGDSSSDIGNFGSSADLLIPDSISQRNAEHRSLHRPFRDLELSDEAQSKRPRLCSVGHHWQHTLVKRPSF